jgi:hypothetical protein
LGGGQAGARRTMITSPGHAPPGLATVTLLVTARARPGGPARIPEPERAWARIMIRPEGQQGGAGANLKQPDSEAEGGLRKICKGAAMLTMLRLSKKRTCQTKMNGRLKSKKGTEAKLESKPGTSLARRPGVAVQAVVILWPFDPRPPDERPSRCRSSVSRGRDPGPGRIWDILCAVGGRQRSDSGPPA